jgi:glycosyltransferase involved in cell wall biosynthesis
MRILFVSPLGFAVGPGMRYTGIERLVYDYTSELVKEHEVGVLGHADSVYPEGVKLYPTRPEKRDIFILDEWQQFQTWQHILRDYDVIHDFSHRHCPSTVIPNLPSLNLFWHAPNEIQYPKAPYNIIGLSKWACMMFQQYYKQAARFQQSIVVDPKKYHRTTEKRNDRFLTIGRMAPEKGNLEAAMLCKKAGVPLDIVGGRGAEKSDEPLSDYEKDIAKICNKDIQLLGEVSDEEKIKLMQTCKALIYYTHRQEVTSHKVQEAMFTGCPVIVPNIGALPEIVTHWVDGILCDSEKDYLWAIKHVDKIRINEEHYREFVETYSLSEVVKNYIPLYREVANGLRW